MTAAKAKVKYKDSPFPRRRESHPKLAAKEIPAFAGMETGSGGGIAGKIYHLVPKFISARICGQFIANSEDKRCLINERRIG